MQNPFQHAPNPCDQLSTYRATINLDTPFTATLSNLGNTKELLRTAILGVWDRTAERELDIHLDTFLKYMAKDVPSLRQLLQLASQACAVITLTDAALNLVDQAYAAAGAYEHFDYDCYNPIEVLRCPSGTNVLVYDKHHELPADATVAICTDSFALPPGDYRSFRINALCGPRVRRDCAIVRERLATNPWAIATRAYFLPSRFVVHSRRPYLDSDLSTRQRLHLREAYLDTLALSFAIGAKTISLPLITANGSRSTEQKAFRTALEAIHSAETMGWTFKTIHLTGVNVSPSSQTTTLGTAASTSNRLSALR